MLPGRRYREGSVSVCDVEYTDTLAGGPGPTPPWVGSSAGTDLVLCFSVLCDVDDTDNGRGGS